MLAAPEPRPAQLKTEPATVSAAPQAESALASLLDTAPPVQRLRRLSAMLNHGGGVAPVQRAAVIQRLTIDGVEITGAMVAGENDLAVLRRWLAEAAWDDAIKDDIAARIQVLEAADLQRQQAAAAAAQQQQVAAAAAAAAALAQQQAAAAAAEQQRAQQAMAAAGVAPAAFDYATYQALAARNLREEQRAEFFLAGGANAAAACTAIVNAGQSPNAIKKGMVAFSKGANQAQAVRIAGVYDTVMAWHKANIDIDLLEELLGEGVLGFHEHMYRDDAREAGAVYVFSFAYLPMVDRVDAEWHVHFGVHDVIKSASWKNAAARFRRGHGARVDTGAATNQRLIALVS